MGRADEEVAARLAVSRSYVAAAKKVKKDAPTEFERIRRGRTTVSRAGQVIRYYHKADEEIERRRAEGRISPQDHKDLKEWLDIQRQRVEKGEIQAETVARGMKKHLSECLERSHFTAKELEDKEAEEAARSLTKEAERFYWKLRRFNEEYHHDDVPYLAAISLISHLIGIRDQTETLFRGGPFSDLDPEDVEIDLRALPAAATNAEETYATD